MKVLLLFQHPPPSTPTPPPGTGQPTHLHGHSGPKARKIPRVEVSPSRNHRLRAASPPRQKIVVVPFSRVRSAANRPAKGPHPPILEVGEQPGRYMESVSKCLSAGEEREGVRRPRREEEQGGRLADWIYCTRRVSMQTLCVAGWRCALSEARCRGVAR